MFFIMSIFLFVSDCDVEGCESQCPFVSGKTAPCNCGKGPKIPASE